MSRNLQKTALKENSRTEISKEKTVFEDCFDGFVPRVFGVTLLVTCLSFPYWQCAYYHGPGFITRIFLAVMFVQKSPLNVDANSTQQTTLSPTSHSTSIPSISPSFTTTTSVLSTQAAASTVTSNPRTYYPKLMNHHGSLQISCPNRGVDL